jgi:hypothetical protein
METNEDEDEHRHIHEDCRERFEDEIKKLSDIDITKDIFIIDFEVPKKYHYRLQRNFGKKMKEFLEGLNYSKK